ncbi:MAG: hypothetical protein NWF10_07815 [Candidatus Bathyarchaeota archaeon]|nr:hypothetical protein [Candidatus Bathyarchaeota archaeon]
MNKKGQFSIIAALLVAVVLVSALITTYSAIRYSQIEDQPEILSAIDETNLSIKQILGFTVGYYGSILKITGNSSYAQNQAESYLQSGLNNIGDIRPEWSPSFNVTSFDLSTNWFMNTSHSSGEMHIEYDLTGLGVYGISYSASSRLDVLVFNSNSSNQATISILKDETEPLINLGKQNFKFYRYIYGSETWELVSPNVITSFANGTYLIDLPFGVADSYVLQVEDSRGIIVTASSFSKYVTSLSWDDKYATIPDENIIIEVLQNGTIRWLGQTLNSTTSIKPIPPIAIKSIRVSQTINGVDQEVPFQIEDWASNYLVPLGISNDQSIFNSGNMIVSLINSQVSKFTIWWDGSDDAYQTSYAYQNLYFNDNPSSQRLNNGKLELQFSGDFRVTSKINSVSTTASFLQINGKSPSYGSNLAYTIYNGVVRDVIHQEAEWSNGIPNCPNVYSQIVLTLPANVNYYTYQLRLMFINSDQNRTITELNAISLSSSINEIQTENGTIDGLPEIVNTISSSDSFYNFSDGKGAHHWSQFILSTEGAGIIFADIGNQQLYVFDQLAGTTTGAITVESGTENQIELKPITSLTQFNTAINVDWIGAIATFDSTTTPIYEIQEETPTGLWILAELPPSIIITAEN